MRIGINARNILPNKLEGFGHYSLEIISRIVSSHPEHEFFLYFDRKINVPFPVGKNVHLRFVSPPTRHVLLYLFWFEFRLPNWFKKDKIDLFWSPDGILSLRSNVKQIGTIHDINFEHYPEDMPKIASWYFRRYFPKYAAKANQLITVSTYSATDIAKTYNLPLSKIQVIHNGASSQFKPLSLEEKQAVKIEFTKGREYLLFVGSLHPRKNVKRLIAAFHSIAHEFPELDLVIVGSAMWDKNFLGDLSQIESRLVLTGHLPLDQLARLMGAAKIFTFVPYFEGFGIPLVEAMRCGTPILTANVTSLPEVAENAAVYCDPFNLEDIFNQMRMMLKDEKKLEELSRIGLERSREFSWEIAAKKTWEVIEQRI